MSNHPFYCTATPKQKCYFPECNCGEATVSEIGLPRDATAPGAFDEALAMTAQAVADTLDQRASADADSNGDSGLTGSGQIEAHPPASATPRTDAKMLQLLSESLAFKSAQVDLIVVEEAAATKLARQQRDEAQAKVAEYFGTIHWQETRIEELEATPSATEDIEAKEMCRQLGHASFVLKQPGAIFTATERDILARAASMIEALSSARPEERRTDDGAAERVLARTEWAEGKVGLLAHEPGKPAFGAPMNISAQIQELRRVLRLYMNSGRQDG